MELMCLGLPQFCALRRDVRQRTTSEEMQHFQLQCSALLQLLHHLAGSGRDVTKDGVNGSVNCDGTEHNGSVNDDSGIQEDLRKL